MPDARPILAGLGLVLIVLAVAMALPAALDAARGDPGWLAFAKAAGIGLFVGGALLLTPRQGERRALSLKGALVFAVLAWIAAALAGALPLAFSGLGLSFTDAFFESMSGVTSTGATILPRVEAASPGILLWRGMLNWIGGLGFVLFAVALFPLLRIGGMQLFQSESFDRPEKLSPSGGRLAASIGAVYAAFTALGAFALMAAGLSSFDAVVHAMSAISTGGFSTRDGPVGAFAGPAVPWVLTALMIAGSLPFILYVEALRRGPRRLFADSQVRWFFAALAGAALAVFAWLAFARGLAPGRAATEAAFAVASSMTGTGYVAGDLATWGGFPPMLLFLLLFVGGCAGSTTGGIKIFRFQVASAVGWAQVRRLVEPNGVFVPYYNRQPVPDEIAASIMGFFLLFLLSYFALAFGLAALVPSIGLDAALSGAARLIANVGPGFGRELGLGGNVAAFPDPAKWLATAGMLLGRVEIVTLYALAVPAFWRR
jgi:trk system potassium uptake protein TrkH